MPDSQARHFRSRLRTTVNGLWTIIRWTLSLGNKFRREVPVGTGVVVLATLVSQLSAVVAFFLPLKILILLGSEGIPRYFPASFASFDRDVLIVWMSGAAVAAYILHLLAEQAVSRGAEMGARELLRKSRKLVLFENQDRIAARAYKLYTQALAGGVFVGLSVLALAVLYPSIALLLVAYYSAVSLVVVGLHALGSALADRMEDNLPAWVPVIANLGFLLAFFVLVVDFLFGNPPGLIPAIIALLLSKQMSNRMVKSIVNIRRLHEQKDKLNALFFHGHVYSGLTSGERARFWDLLQPEQRVRWVPQAVHQCGADIRIEPDSVRWWPLGQPGVAGVYCRSDGNEAFLVKLFDSNRGAKAVHEADLMASMGTQLPALPYMGSTWVGPCRCNVFRLPGHEVESGEATADNIIAIRSALLKISPAEGLQHAHSRSRPFIWDRLRSGSMLSRLRVAADQESRQILNRLEHQVPQWCRALERMPRAVAVPEIEDGDIVQLAEGGIWLTHWSEWTLEPVGFAWGAGEDEIAALWRALDEARTARKELENVSIETVTLSALTAELDKRFNAEKYEEALPLLARIERVLERIGPRK